MSNAGGGRDVNGREYVRSFVRLFVRLYIRSSVCLFLLCHHTTSPAIPYLLTYLLTYLLLYSYTSILTEQQQLLMYDHTID